MEDWFVVFAFLLEECNCSCSARLLKFQSGLFCAKQSTNGSRYSLGTDSMWQTQHFSRSAFCKCYGTSCAAVGTHAVNSLPTVCPGVAACFAMLCYDGATAGESRYETSHYRHIVCVSNALSNKAEQYQHCCVCNWCSSVRSTRKTKMAEYDGKELREDHHNVMCMMQRADTVDKTCSVRQLTILLHVCV